jgi:ephrin-B
MMDNPLVKLIIWASFCALAASSRVRNIYWNTTTASQNPEPNVVLVNEGNLPWEYDQVNIICPVYKPGVLDPEQHVIYSVTKEEFDTCRVINPRPKIVAICNRPQTFMYFTITFRSFTPTPGGMEFRPGKDYYFISTSNSKDIHRRVGGWCSSHNMKMVFKVVEAPSSKQERELATTTYLPPIPVPTPAAFWSRYYNEARMPEVRPPETRDRYLHGKSFHQSSQLTYFSEDVRSSRSSGSSSSSGIFSPEKRDGSVDITIVASAFSSASTSLLQSYLSVCLLGLSSLLFF